MASFNKVLMIGNLSREVDLRYTQQGKAIAEMSVALNRRNGEHEEVCYVDVVVWGKAAENCQRCLGKGSCVHVEGYLRQEKWEDRETGKSRSKLRVVAENIQFIHFAKGGTTQATRPNPGNSGPIPPEYDPPRRNSAEHEPPVDDDIPF